MPVATAATPKRQHLASLAVRKLRSTIHSTAGGGITDAQSSIPLFRQFLP
jgi:hypothetical protein